MNEGSPFVPEGADQWKAPTQNQENKSQDIKSPEDNDIDYYSPEAIDHRINDLRQAARSENPLEAYSCKLGLNIALNEKTILGARANGREDEVAKRNRDKAVVKSEILSGLMGYGTEEPEKIITYAIQELDELISSLEIRDPEEEMPHSSYNLPSYTENDREWVETAKEQLDIYNQLRQDLQDILTQLHRE